MSALREALAALDFCGDFHKGTRVDGCPFCDCTAELRRLLAEHPEQTLQDKLARAIGDPGSVVGRQHHLDESIPRWSARAVLHVLAEEVRS